jgi:hypothetical protein
MRLGMSMPGAAFNTLPAQRSVACAQVARHVAPGPQRRGLSGSGDAVAPLHRKLALACPANPRTRLRMQAAAD